MVRPRLLVVSMSLPVTANRTGEEAWSFTMSPGGLVSALLGKKIVHNFDNVAINELTTINRLYYFIH